MKNKKVRLLAVLLAGCMLVGCGGSDSANKTEAGNVNSSQEASGQEGSVDDLVSDVVDGATGDNSVTMMVYDFEYSMGDAGDKIEGFTVKNIGSDGMWSDNLTRIGTDIYSVNFKWSGPADFGGNWFIDEKEGISVVSSNGTFEMTLQAGGFDSEEKYLEQFTQEEINIRLLSDMTKSNIQQTPINLVKENGYSKASFICSTSEILFRATSTTDIINDSKSAFVIVGKDDTREVLILQFIVKEYAYSEEMMERFIESVSFCEPIERPVNAQDAIEEVEFDRDYEYSSIDFIDFAKSLNQSTYTPEFYKCIRTDNPSVTDCFIDIYNYDRQTMKYYDKEYLGTIKYSLIDEPRNAGVGNFSIEEDEEYLYKISLRNMKVTLEKYDTSEEMTEAILRDKLNNFYTTEIQEDSYEFESDGEWACALYCYDADNFSAVNAIKFHYESGYVFYVRYSVDTGEAGIKDYVIKDSEHLDEIKSLEFLLR